MSRIVICCALIASMALPLPADQTRQENEGVLLFENSDFESGDLTNWRAEGTAFQYQPTRGDNVRAREAGVSGGTSGHQGEWWTGTYEMYRGGAGEAVGRAQGDAPIGGLLSADFIIRKPYITFLVGGGGSGQTSVQLIVAGEVVRSAAGRNRETMERVYWDVRDLVDRKGMIYIQDSGKSAWGHINVDDFRAVDAGPRLLFPNSDFESGDLTNWTAEGLAFTSQPTQGDNAGVRHRDKRAVPQGRWWIGTYENYQGKEGQVPGTVQDDLPTGTLRSQPFEIGADAIAFLVGGGSAEEVAVHLRVEDQIVHTARGDRAELMQRVEWDVRPYRGKQAVIEIVDQGADIWGHINADYFHYPE